jgi:hypothetical protein
MGLSRPFIPKLFASLYAVASRERAMPNYRAFQLDRTGHVVGKLELACADDEDAKEQAVRLSRGEAVEVWRLDRMVAVVRSKTNSPKGN